MWRDAAAHWVVWVISSDPAHVMVGTVSVNIRLKLVYPDPPSTTSRGVFAPAPPQPAPKMAQTPSAKSAENETYWQMSLLKLSQ